MKVLRKIKSEYKLLYESNIFKMSFYLLIIIALYETFFMTKEFSYINSFLACFCDSFIMNILLVIILINTYNSVILFDKNEFYVIRLENKYKYIFSLIKKIITNCFIIASIYSIAIIIGIICFNRNGIIIAPIGNYNVNNLTYTIFYYIRILILFELFSMLSLFVLKLLKNRLYIVYMLVVSFVNFFLKNILTAIFPFEHIFKKYHFIISDFFQISEYKSFIDELLVSLSYCGIMVILILFLFLLHIKINRRIYD